MQETAEAVESPQESEEINFSDVATDALREALGTETESVPEIGETESPEVEETQAQDESEPTGEVSLEEEFSDAQETTEDDTSEDRLAKRRIRPRNEQDQQVIDLYRSSGFTGSFQDASDIIYGRNQQQAPQPEAQPQQVEPKEDPFVSEVNSLKDKIVELESQITEANEELDTGKAMELQRELFRNELKMNDIQHQRQIAEERQRQSIEEVQRQKALESRDRAVARYPELDNKESIYRKEFDNFIQQAGQNPEYAAVFESPRWAEIMANEFAIIKGQAPISSETPVQPQPPQQQAPQMGNQAKVLTTGQTAKPANQPLTAEQVVNNMDKLSNDQIYSLLGQPDGRKFLR